MKKNKNLNFTVLSEKYIEDRLYEHTGADIERPLSKSTYKEAVYLVTKHLRPFIKRTPVKDIDQPYFNEYCRFKRKSGLNLTNHRKVLNHFLKWCVKNGYMNHRPELEVPKFASKSRRKREILTNSEINALFSVYKMPIHLYVVLYLLHGMRNMEICKLKWSDIDWEKRGLYINPENNRTRKARAIPLNSYAINLLKITHDKKINDYVFPSRSKSGKKGHIDPSGGIRFAWKNALKEAGISRNITPHDMRATFETHMHMRPDFTDTQREKMAGAKIDVQKDVYVKMSIDQLRGLEDSVKIEGMDQNFKKVEK